MKRRRSLKTKKISQAMQNRACRLSEALVKELRAKSPDFKAVQNLVMRGADINYANNLGWTELQLAAMEGDTELVRRLLAVGADIHLADGAGWSALHEAAYYGHLETTMLLLKAGASPNRVLSKEDKRDPFLLASSQGHVDIALLLQPFSFLKKEEWSSYHIAAYKGDIRFLRKYYESHSQFIDEENIYGWTPLRLASMNGQKKTIEFFIEKGVKVDVANQEGKTALHFAAFNQHLQALKVLILGGANIHAKDKGGATPLHSACEGRKGDVKILTVLFQNGANLNEKDTVEQTPLHYAVKAAGFPASLEKVKHLIMLGAEINMTNNKGETPLHLCRATALAYSVAIAEVLIAKGASLDQKNKDGYNARQIFSGIGSPRAKKILSFMPKAKVLPLFES